MLDYFQRKYGLSREDAYRLTCVAVVPKISEVVDVPDWEVSAFLPLELFN